ncbi:hypothetical protein BJX62DRAFT_106896 [Aspergillus germanicus]
MATLRPGKSYAEAAVAPSPGEKTAVGDSDTSPAVPMHVIWKLVGFTAAMITTPVGTYFVSVSFGCASSSPFFTFVFCLLYLCLLSTLPFTASVSHSSGCAYTRLMSTLYTQTAICMRANNQPASTTVAAILAAVMANIILFLYVYVAWQEDKEEREAEAAKRKGRKAQ